MSEEEFKLVVVVDRGGRQFLGKIDGQRGSTIVRLKDHLKYAERQIPAQSGGAQVQLQFEPPSHMFKLGSIELQWLSVEPIEDSNFIKAYEDFWMKIRAARSGIITASAAQIPKSNGRIKVPGH